MRQLKKAQLEAASQIRVAVYDDPDAALPGMRKFSTKHRTESGRLLAAALKWTCADELARELERTLDHLRSFAEYAPMGRTAETDAILYCSRAVLDKHKVLACKDPS